MLSYTTIKSYTGNIDLLAKDKLRNHSRPGVLRIFSVPEYFKVPCEKAVQAWEEAVKSIYLLTTTGFFGSFKANVH